MVAGSSDLSYFSEAIENDKVMKYVSSAIGQIGTNGRSCLVVKTKSVDACFQDNNVLVVLHYSYLHMDKICVLCLDIDE